MSPRRCAALAVVGAVTLAAALPAGAGGSRSPGRAAATSPLCTAFRRADPVGFRQLFPGTGGLALCSRIQTRREACVIRTERDLRAPNNFLFRFTCRPRVTRLRAAATKAVTQFIFSLRRTITGVGPVYIGGTPPRPVKFDCGVRGYLGRSSLVCIHGSVPYGKYALGTETLSPDMGCDVRPLVALRVANGNWDIFAITRAPRTLNGPACPGPHF